MLNPEVKAACTQLADGYDTITRVDGFAYSMRNTSVGFLTPDPTWLGTVRSDLALLHAAGNSWQTAKPQLWAPLLTDFTTYTSLIQSVAQVGPMLGDDVDQWKALLGSMSTALGSAATKATASQTAFATHIAALKALEQSFDANLTKAWGELDAEEHEMIALSKQIALLQNRIDELNASLSSTGISAGKSYVQSSLSIAYTLVSTAGDDIPFLSIAGQVLTLGKAAYDVFVTDKELNESIDKFEKARINLSVEAQAAAMTKAIIHMINGFDKRLAAVEHALPDLATMWSDEKARVDQLMDSLDAGAVPSKSLELKTLGQSAAEWQKLADFVLPLLGSPTQGAPVHLSLAHKPSTAIAATNPATPSARWPRP